MVFLEAHGPCPTPLFAWLTSHRPRCFRTRISKLKSPRVDVSCFDPLRFETQSGRLPARVLRSTNAENALCVLNTSGLLMRFAFRNPQGPRHLLVCVHDCVSRFDDMRFRTCVLNPCFPRVEYILKLASRVLRHISNPKTSVLCLIDSCAGQRSHTLIALSAHVSTELCKECGPSDDMHASVMPARLGTCAPGKPKLCGMPTAAA